MQTDQALVKKMNKTPRRVYFALLAIVTLVALMLPSPFWIVVCVPLLLGVIWSAESKRLHSSWTTYIVFGFVILKLLGVFSMIYAVDHTPPRLTSPSNYFVKFFPLSIGGIWDIERAEHSVRRRFLSVARRSPTAVRTVDPFSGTPLREAKGHLYSVGPDQVDQGMALIYDPTNGTFSEGDIPIGIWEYEDSNEGRQAGEEFRKR